MILGVFARFRCLCACLSCAVVCLLISSPSIAADDTSAAMQEIQELRQTINDLQQRLTDLENKLKTAEAAPAKTSEAAQYPKLKLDGYLQARYSVDNAQNGVDQFLIRRARLNLRGAISEHVSSRVELGMDGREPGEGRGSEVYLKKAYIDYLSKPGLLRFGQTSVPFGYEVPESSSQLWAAERSFVADRLFPDQVDLGVQYQYSPGNRKPTYNLALFNGTGMDQNDDNSRKNPVASVYVPVGSADATVGYYNGVAGSGVGETDQSRLGGGVKWENSRLAFMGEYIAGEDLGEHVAGWYSQLGYKLPRASLLFVKYDQYDENTGQPNDLFKRTTVGWFRDFTPNDRVTVVYEFLDPQPGFSDFSTWNGNMGFIQWQVIY